MAVLGYAVENWTEFDAWCLSQGFDPLEVPSRRLVSAAWAFLTQEMEQEIKDKLIYELTVGETIQQFIKEETPNVKPTTEGTTTVAPTKWKAPEGWTPPGWDEEKSYQTSVQFMGFNANPK